MSFNSQIITVTQLNTYIKAILEENNILNNLFVKGEISNFKKHYASGHMYFTLKDKDAAISCVMFKGNGEKLLFKLEDGLKIILNGKISIYERTGNMQMYVNDAQPDGIGALTLAFEQLKRNLEKEGLFDQKYKKTIPKFPKKIGILTSKTGSVLQDIINVISRRYPISNLLLYPTAVQGENASKEISEGLQYLDEIGCDVILVGRGGGSIEDLWAFNTELVARSIFNVITPVISAVGHETDYTIADFVSDLRAPTPSAAAELATPDKREVFSFISTSITGQKKFLGKKINDEMIKVKTLKEGRGFSRMTQKILDEKNKLKTFFYKYNINIKLIFNKNKEKYKKEIGKLESLSPFSVLSRGYTVIENNNGIVDSIRKTEINDMLYINLSDGKITSKVVNIEKREK